MIRVHLIKDTGYLGAVGWPIPFLDFAEGVRYPIFFRDPGDEPFGLLSGYPWHVRWFLKVEALHELVLKYGLHLRMLYQEHLQHGQWKNPFWVIEVVQGVKSFWRLRDFPGIDYGGKFPIRVEFCNAV